LITIVVTLVTFMYVVEGRLSEFRATVN